MTACPKMTVIRDKRYTQDAKNRPCLAIERDDHDGDVVVAHINIAGNFGRGQKASDEESLDLCWFHHMEMDQYPAQRDRWIVQNIVLPWRRAAFDDWRAER